MNQEVIDKIRKLLNLGNRGGTQAESELAMAKAQELAILNNINLSAIKMNESVEQYEEKYIQEGTQRKSVCQKFITWILQNHFNVTVIYRGANVLVIGKTSDCQIAEYVQGFLSREMMNLWKEYKKINNAPVSSRNSFIYGVYLGLSNKLTASKNEVEAAKFKEIADAQGQDESDKVKGNYQLAVVDSSKERANAVKKFCPRLRNVLTSVGRTHCGDAVSSGKAVGSRINLHQGVGDKNQMALA